MSACRPTVGLDQGDATTGAGRRGDHRRRHGWGRRPSACGSDLTHAFDASHYGELKPGGAATIRPSERRTRRRQAASGGGPRRWWSTRELEGQRGCPGGPAAHPRRVYVLGAGGGGLQWWQSCTVAGGRRGRRRGRCRRFQGSRLDSVGVEAEEVTAELLVPSACPEVVGIDGDAAAAPARSRPWRLLGLGFLGAWEMRGRESRAASGCFLSSRGSGARQGVVRGVLGGVASVSRGTWQRAVREVRKEKIFTKPPGRSFFICKMVQQQFTKFN